MFDRQLHGRGELSGTLVGSKGTSALKCRELNLTSSITIVNWAPDSLVQA
jgi:hypothetical protein